MVTVERGAAETFKAKRIERERKRKEALEKRRKEFQEKKAAERTAKVPKVSEETKAQLRVETTKDSQGEIVKQEFFDKAGRLIIRETYDSIETEPKVIGITRSGIETTRTKVNIKRETYDPDVPLLLPRVETGRGTLTTRTKGKIFTTQPPRTKNLEEQIDSLKSEVNTKVQEIMEKDEEILKEQCRSVFYRSTSDMTEVQIDELRQLIEDVEFDTAESFEKKLTIMKEKFMETTTDTKTEKEEENSITEEIIEEIVEEKKDVDGKVKNWASYL